MTGVITRMCTRQLGCALAPIPYQNLQREAYTAQIRYACAKLCVREWEYLGGVLREAEDIMWDTNVEKARSPSAGQEAR